MVFYFLDVPKLYIKYNHGLLKKKTKKLDRQNEMVQNNTNTAVKQHNWGAVVIWGGVQGQGWKDQAGKCHLHAVEGRCVASHGSGEAEKASLWALCLC